MSDESQQTDAEETAAENPATEGAAPATEAATATENQPAEDSGDPQAATAEDPAPTSTRETTTVEQANANYMGGTADDQRDADSAPGDSVSELSTSSAPAFQEQAEEVPDRPVPLPTDPDGSQLLALTREVLTGELIPNQRNGAIYDCLFGVCQSDSTLRACSEVLHRILQHADARKVSVRSDASVTRKVLDDVLIGTEAEHFADRGLDEQWIVEFYQQVTPAVIAKLDQQPTVA